MPPLAFGAPWDTWIYRALVLLVVSCPCALVISTPVSIVVGAGGRRAQGRADQRRCASRARWRRPVRRVRQDRHADARGCPKSSRWSPLNGAHPEGDRGAGGRRRAALGTSRSRRRSCATPTASRIARRPPAGFPVAAGPRRRRARRSARRCSSEIIGCSKNAGCARRRCTRTSTRLGAAAARRCWSRATAQPVGVIAIADQPRETSARRRRPAAAAWHRVTS